MIFSGNDPTVVPSRTVAISALLGSEKYTVALWGSLEFSILLRTIDCMKPQ